MASDLLEVQYPDEDFRRDTYFINVEDYDPGVHELAEGQDPPDESSADESAPEVSPSSALEELVGAQAAAALAGAGLTTIEEAQAYDGDLTEIDGVGDVTADQVAGA